MSRAPLRRRPVPPGGRRDGDVKGGAIEMVGGFETTFLPAHDRDVAETTQHHVRWRDDMGLLRHHGVSRLRQAIRWHRIESERGRYDWRATDELMGHLHDAGLRP